MEQKSWNDDFIDLDEINLHYYRTGGKKPALILLHGFTDNGLCWTRVTRALEKDFDIIMPDIRGHGKSTTDQLDYSLEAASEDIFKLINALSLINPILIGHSMGAQIATIISSNHPDIISSLILEDPAYMFDANSFKAKFITLAFKFMIKRNMKKSEQQLRKSINKLNPKWDEDEKYYWALAQKEFSNNNPLIVFDNLSVNVHWHELFQSIKVPTLLIISSKGFLRKDEAKLIIPEFQNAKLVFIKDAGHSIRRDKFEEFMEAITSFIL